MCLREGWRLDDDLAGTAGGHRPGWWEPAGPEDLATVREQLGRTPQGILAVAARCRFGRPSVVVTAPVIPGPRAQVRPFPTTFWLTCPYLVEAVSRLESAGWIARISQEIKAQPASLEQLREAHRGAARLRAGLLGAGAARRLQQLSPQAVARLRQVGVAGSRDFDAVKCLHAHLADHLGRGGNPVGRRVVALLAAQGVALSGSPRCATEAAGSGEAPCLRPSPSAPYNRGGGPGQGLPG